MRTGPICRCRGGAPRSGGGTREMLRTARGGLLTAHPFPSPCPHLLPLESSFSTAYKLPYAGEAQTLPDGALSGPSWVPLMRSSAGSSATSSKSVKQTVTDRRKVRTTLSSFQTCVPGVWQRHREPRVHLVWVGKGEEPGRWEASR